MKKNRDYTGLERTPSSMAWLIRVRQVRKGQLDKFLALQARLPEQIALAQQELAAIDAVIPFHEVKVDPDAIAGRQPRRKAMAPYGQLTRQIIRCLKAASGRPVLTPEIAYYVAREAGVDLNQMRPSDLMTRVRDRLRAMCRLGIVHRHHPRETEDVGTWSLAIDQAEDSVRNGAGL